jgi:plasmid stabilization system protein ParE
LIGRVVPEIGDEHIRERFIYSYRLVYRVEPGRILVVAVIHGKRLIESISERFEDSA